MTFRDLCSTLAVLAGVPWLALPCNVQAAGGLVVVEAESVWPQWQARLALQTAPLATWGLWRLQDVSSLAPNGQPGSSGQAAQGGAVLGDYYFAQRSLGAFRASGGLMFGATGGAPAWVSQVSQTRPGLVMHSVGALAAPGAEAPGAVPYLGLGFTTAGWRQTLSLSADLGWVAEQPSAIGGVGRALFGNQGWETALREIRLAPVFQLAVRYTF